MALETAPQTDDVMEVAEVVPRSLSQEGADLVVHFASLVRPAEYRFFEPVIAKEVVAA